MCPNKNHPDWKEMVEKYGKIEAFRHWLKGNYSVSDAERSDQSKIAEVPIKEGVSELFDFNPELANQVYEALGFEIPTTKLQGKKVGETKLFDVVKEITSGERSKLASSILINKLLKGKYLPKIKESEIILGLSEAGEWDPVTKKITAFGKRKSTLAKKIAHELLHSVTENIILSYQNLKGDIDFTDKQYSFYIKRGAIKPVKLSKTQIEALDNLVRIRNKVISYIEQNKDKIQNQYGGGFGSYDYFINTNYSNSETDLHEFISEIFTNPELVNILKQIPSEGKKSNLFKDFVEAIARILGFTNTSILEDIVAYSEEAFFQQPQITPQQKQQAQQQYSQYLDTIFPDSKVKDIVYHDTSHNKAIKNYKEYLQGKYDKKIDYINKETFGDPNYIEVFFKDGTSKILNEKESLKFVPFETFDKNLIGNIDGSVSGKGFYFYTNPEEKYDRSRFFTLNALINVKNTANKSDSDLKDLFEESNKATDLLKKQGYDSVVGKLSTIGTEYVVFEPEQIHILGSQKDMKGFKEFVGKTEKKVDNTIFKPTSFEIQKQKPSTSGVMREFKGRSINEIFEQHKEALEQAGITLEQLKHSATKNNLSNEEIEKWLQTCLGSSKKGSSNIRPPMAKQGMKSSKFTKGGKWKLIKDLKGYPTHEKGGVDLMIGKDGVSITSGQSNFKAEYGLVLPKAQSESTSVNMPIMQGGGVIKNNPNNTDNEAPSFDYSNTVIPRDNTNVVIPQENYDDLLKQSLNAETEEYERFKNSLPDNLKYTDESNYDMKYLWFHGGKPTSFEESINRENPMFSLEKDGLYHGPSVEPNTLQFVKRYDHPTLHKELDWFNSAEGEKFREEHDLDKSGEFYRYVLREKQKS